MQTPSETKCKSVFGNFAHGGSPEPDEPWNTKPPVFPAALADDKPLQIRIDIAMARAFVYRLLAKAFEDPGSENWSWLTENATQRTLRSAIAILDEQMTANIEKAAEKFLAHLRVENFDALAADYLSAFGHAARGPCPVNEIEYGDLKADPLFQPHRLADLAAFYRAFGVEVSSDAGERHDHLCLELEFMSFLAGKEAYALENQLDDELMNVCRDAQRKFLREHLGRWTPAFTRRLIQAVGEGPLAATAGFLGKFIESDCHWFGVKAGSEDLLLRPVDEKEEMLCASCGITNLPPGASPGACSEASA